MSPSAEDVQAAGVAFDAGRQAFREEHFEEAAEHFERADTLAPNAKVLHNAVSARVSAGQLDRAATSAALALKLYPNDEKLTAEMTDLIARLSPDLHRLQVSCDPSCSLLVGTRLVHGVAATEHTLFLNPGEQEIQASFPGGHSLKQVHTGVAGATDQISFTLPRPSQTPPVVAPVASVVTPIAAQEPAPQEDTGKSSKASGGLPKGIFWTGVGLTAVAAGVSVWSAIDTKNNPGKAKVLEKCVNLGTACSYYKDGKDKEKRTDLLWAGTAGLAVATAVVGVFATHWSTEPASSSEDDSSRGVAVVPLLDGRQAGLWATGRF